MRVFIRAQKLGVYLKTYRFYSFFKLRKAKSSIYSRTMDGAGVWADDYEDDDFLDYYGEAEEVPDPEERKKAKIIDPDDPDQPKKPKERKPVQNPRPKLDVDRLLCEERGLPELLRMAGNITFRKGREMKDMKRVLALYELWSHRLFPKYTFDDFLTKCETLGKKRPIKTHLRKVRLGMIQY